MNKRIILVGAGASGKSKFMDFLRDQGYNINVSYTTRPQREGEVDGKDYHFINEEEFAELSQNNFFHEIVEFNRWNYGTSQQQWQSKYHCIKTPTGLAKLKWTEIKNSIIVWFDIHEEYRLRRLMGRSDADSVERRILSDRKDFFNFNNFDIRVINPIFDSHTLLETIKLYDKI